MSVFSKIKPSLIIHTFAVMHAIVALSCRLAGIEDELLLTLLTMAMVLLVCFRKKFSIEFTAAVIIIANILGYLFGTLGATILEHLIKNPYAIHAISTAVTTEILGWCVVGISRIFPKMRSDSASKLTPSSLKWALLAAAGIFILRLAILFIYSRISIDAESVYGMTSKLLSNSVGMIVLICINIMYVIRLRNKYKSHSKISKTLSISAFMIACALLESIIAGSGIPFKFDADFTRNFPLIFLISLLTQITIYCLVYVINYAFTARTEMHMEREKANMAQYRYLKLKRQVDPHFLFNSLNILDCLVCEEKTEQASTYIHKLAGIYRYMIKSEDEDIVPLRDELTFVNQYVDLLKLRFPEGFEVNIDVPEEAMSRYILPCSIQLLIENATKHNTVNKENPLIIKINVMSSGVRVSNNLIPKVTRPDSTGLGQKYISQQYMDLCGKEIEISNSNGEYCVTLPLL